jgi:cyclopropane-fatty-acyl-phospholipid synthase
LFKERGLRREVTKMGVEAFRRRWVYYFSYCDARLRAGVLGDHVIVARKRPSGEEGEGMPV